MYKLDMGDPEEFYWGKVEISGPSPTPRWHHSSNLLSDSKTFITFGGFGTKSQPRLNDVWLFDTEAESWSQPSTGKTEEINGVVKFKVEWKVRAG